MIDMIEGFFEFTQHRESRLSGVLNGQANGFALFILVMDRPNAGPSLEPEFENRATVEHLLFSHRADGDVRSEIPFNHPRNGRKQIILTTLIGKSVRRFPSAGRKRSS